MAYTLNYSLITKKVIDLLVDFLKTHARTSRLYQHTQVSDRFNLEATRVPAIIVKSVSNTQRRIHYDDFIQDLHGRVELVPIQADNNLVGNNIQRVNLPNTLDYDPRWALDPTIGYPTGTDITTTAFTQTPFQAQIVDLTGTNITVPTYTTSSGVSTLNSGVTSAIIITLPPANSFNPTSLVWALDNIRVDGDPSPIIANGKTVNPTGLILENHVNLGYSQNASGTFSIPLNISTILPTGIDTSGINAVYSGNNTTSGMFPFSGHGINGAGWFQSGTSLNWTNGWYTNFAAASTAGQMPSSGSFYGVDYSYSGPDIHTIAVAISEDQDQFYLVYSGISISGIVIQPVEPDQLIVNASGLVPGLTGTSIKLSDVLWAGDQYQVWTYTSDQLIYGIYGGIYDMSIGFECYAMSTIEAQELGDLVERFLVENKKNPYDIAGFNLTGWSQPGQGEEAYINSNIFSTSVSCEGFHFWHDYRSADVITSASGTVIASGIVIFTGQYVSPGVEAAIDYTNPTYPGGLSNL